MPTYEALDAVADAYVPLLAVLTLAGIGITAWQRRWRELSTRLTLLALGLGVAYGIMALDAWLLLWADLGLDYSTHTAVALILVITLMLMIGRLRWVWLGSLGAYAVLMRVQGYHSIADILSTAAIVTIALLPGIVWASQGMFRWSRGQEHS